MSDSYLSDDEERRIARRIFDVMAERLDDVPVERSQIEGVETVFVTDDADDQLWFANAASSTVRDTVVTVHESVRRLLTDTKEYVTALFAELYTENEVGGE